MIQDSTSGKTVPGPSQKSWTTSPKGSQGQGSSVGSQGTKPSNGLGTLWEGIVVLLVLNLIDTVSTSIGLLSGYFQEANPLGFVGALTLKLVCLGTLLWSYYSHGQWISTTLVMKTIRFVQLCYFVVVGYHVGLWLSMLWKAIR